MLPVLLFAQLVAVACLYLACKVQESSKYLRDVIKVAETRKWAKWCEEHPTERRKWEDPVRPFLPKMHSLAHPVKQAYTLCCVLLPCGRQTDAQGPMTALQTFLRMGRTGHHVCADLVLPLACLPIVCLSACHAPGRTTWSVCVLRC